MKYCLFSMLLASFLVACGEEDKDTGDVPSPGDTQDTGASGPDTGDTGEGPPGDTGETADTGDSGGSTDTGPQETDADDDGWPESEDCDDTDPDVNPGATEVCDDDVDNDCDGAADRCALEGASDLSDADVVISGGSGDNFGMSVAVGDADGDGYGDLLVGATGLGGAAGGGYLFSGPLSGVTDTNGATATIEGSGAEEVGTEVHLEDLNLDGYADLVLGAELASGGGYYSGSSYVLHGPLTGTRSVLDADSIIPGEESYAMAYGPFDAGDLTGDGAMELAVGSIGASNSGGTMSGSVYLVPWPQGDLVNLAGISTRLDGESGSDYAGSGVSVADADGDGQDDIWVGARNAATAYWVQGPITAATNLSSADAACSGAGGTGSGIDQADINGDGLPDAIIGAGGLDEGGGAYVVLAPYGDADLSTDAQATLTVSGAGYYDVNISLAAGDVDGDGYGDVVVGSTPVYNYAGAGFLVYGPITGERDLLSDADASLSGGSGDYAGYGSDVADIDADGLEDLVISTPYDGGTAGGAYVMFSEL